MSRGISLVKRETSVEELPRSDWPVTMSVKRVSSLMTVGGTMSRLVKLHAVSTKTDS